MNKQSLQKGYTLLFAVIIAALVLGIAAFIVGVARKQYIISATARDSIYALYAADSGIECAVMAGPANYDLSGGLDMGTISCDDGNSTNVTFGAITDQNVGLENNIPVGFLDYHTYPIYQAPPPAQPPDYIRIPLNYTDGLITRSYGCVLLKIWSGTGTNGKPKVYVESRGYNVCDGSEATLGPSASVRTVERGLWWSQ